MNEEDDMLELLDEDDLASDTPESDELELTDDTDELSEGSPEVLLKLEESKEEPVEHLTPDDAGRGGSAEPENGIEIDIKYLIIAAVAIAAILIGAVFFVLPIFADKAPVVTINPSQTGEDLLPLPCRGRCS